MKLKYFVVIFLSLMACRKTINYKIPNKQKILVVNSVLINDSFIAIELSQTQGITDNVPNITINDALISIYDKDTNLIEELSNSGNGRYLSLINKGIEMKFYIAKISIQNSQYWVSDSIPQKSISIVKDTSRSLFLGRPNYFNIDYKIKDIQNITNNYGLRVKRFFEKYQTINSIIDTAYIEEWLIIDTKDFILTENEITQFSKEQLLFNDRNFNNTEIEVKFGNANLFNQKSQKTLKLIIYLEQYSISGFEYYRSLNEHLFYQNDPFSQPSALKGNVHNAYGAFVGKSIKADTIKFY